MKKQSGYTIFTAVFFLLCLVPSLGMLLGTEEAAGANERLASLPALRDGEGALNRDYLSQLSAYAEDHYFLRQDLVTAWSRLNREALRTSVTEDVLLGRDGWLYFGGTLDDYTGLAPMTEAETAAAARNLALMDEYCGSRGASFLFAIAPNKNSLYPGHMPDLPVFSGHRNAEALGEALEAEGVAFCDLFALFRGQEEELYFPRDSHWDGKGAALAADGINAALGRQSDYFAGPFREEADHRGDLYAMLDPAGTGLETDRRYAGELSFDYEAPIRSAEDLNIRTLGGGEGSLLMFRDSFGNLLYPYLADSFARAQFSRTPAYRLDQIDAREADCVVVELVERNLRWLLENVPVMPAPAREEAPDAPDLRDLPWTAEPAANLPGYVLVQGTLEGTGPAVLNTEAGAREAFRLAGGGFALYLPENEIPSRNQEES